jgi:hypothetical protein
MSDHSEEAIVPPLLRYPPADISPAEFEQFVVDALSSMGGDLENYTVTLHETIVGGDGTYDFDATVRYSAMGMSFLLVVEAKQHSYPIKRQDVQVLKQKKDSVAAQKAALFSTAKFQSGAVSFAIAHGIALVYITEGRLTFETRSRDGHPPPTREVAHEMGVPTVVGRSFSAGDSAASITISSIHPGDMSRLREQLLDLRPDQPSTRPPEAR